MSDTEDSGSISYSSDASDSEKDTKNNSKGENNTTPDNINPAPNNPNSHPNSQKSDKKDTITKGETPNKPNNPSKCCILV